MTWGRVIDVFRSAPTVHSEGSVLEFYLDVVTKGDPNANPPKPPSVLVKLDAKDLEAQLRAAEAHYAAQAGALTVAAPAGTTVTAARPLAPGLVEGVDVRAMHRALWPLRWTERWGRGARSQAARP